MYYCLNKDVYIVDGLKKSCIYDLSKGHLYSINHNLAKVLRRINECYYDIEYNFKDELKDIINILIEKEVISTSTTQKINNIEDLKVNYKTSKLAWIEITSKCNLKCIHCYNESDDFKYHDMSVEDYKYTIDFLLANEITKLQIIGGEPFVNPTILKEMLEYSVGKFELLEIFTNGTLIPNDFYDYLKKHNIRIALSVYSYNNIDHDKVTNVIGAHYKTNQTIANLKKYGIQYRICNVLMDGITLGQQNTNLYKLDPEKDVVRMSGRANYKLLTHELIKKKLITKKTFETPINKSFVTRLVSGHNCFSNRIYVSSDLNVYPCVMERRISHGNIKENNLLKFNINILNFNKDHIDDCRCCEYRYACFDCRPNSLETNIASKPWYCTYNVNDGVWIDQEIFIDNLDKKWLE